MKERQKIRRTSAATLGLTQEKADYSMAEVALLAVMQRDATETKKQFDRESILAFAGSKDGINDVIHQYEIDNWKHEEMDSHSKDEGKAADMSDKDEMIALKMAQQRLETEIRYEEDLKEQLKLSSIKQVCDNNSYTALVTALKCKIVGTLHTLSNNRFISISWVCFNHILSSAYHLLALAHATKHAVQFYRTDRALHSAIFYLLLLSD